MALKDAVPSFCPDLVLALKLGRPGFHGYHAYYTIEGVACLGIEGARECWSCGLRQPSYTVPGENLGKKSGSRLRIDGAGVVYNAATVKK